MEGWVDLGYPAMHRLGFELAIFRSRVRRPTTILPSQPKCTTAKTYPVIWKVPGWNRTVLIPSMPQLLSLPSRRRYPQELPWQLQGTVHHVTSRLSRPGDQTATSGPVRSPAVSATHTHPYSVDTTQLQKSSGIFASLCYKWSTDVWCKAARWYIMLQLWYHGMAKFKKGKNYRQTKRKKIIRNTNLCLDQQHCSNQVQLVLRWIAIITDRAANLQSSSNSSTFPWLFPN